MIYCDIFLRCKKEGILLLDKIIFFSVLFIMQILCLSYEISMELHL
jgi:hypothetical protein